MKAYSATRTPVTKDIAALRDASRRIARQVKELRALQRQHSHEDALVSQVVFEVSRVWMVNEADIFAECQRRHVSEARQVVMYLVRELTGWSFPTIGLCIGDRDHSTVMHGVNMTIRRIGSVVDFSEKVIRARGACARYLLRDSTEVEAA